MSSPPSPGAAGGPPRARDDQALDSPGRSPAGHDTSHNLSDVAPTPPRGTFRPDIPEQLGRYRVLRLLGQGGMGAVFLADDPLLKRQVALKIPQFDPRHAVQMRARFLREAQAAALLAHHPNICQVYDVSEIDGHLCMTMEFVDGVTLAELISRRQMFSERQAAVLIRQVALAVDAAHQKGVIHRDLKPSNVMVVRAAGAQKSGDPKVMDFGLAKRLDTTSAQLTQSGMVMGTPCYMSREQWAAGEGDVGPASDVYSLGVIFYELLTGKRPYDLKPDEPPTAWLAKLLTETPVPARQRRPDLDIELAGICHQALAADVYDRFPTMSAFAAALQEWLSGQSTPSPIPIGTRLPQPRRRKKRKTAAEPPPPPPPPPPSRWRFWPLVAGSVGLITLIVAAILVRPDSKPSTSPTSETSTASDPPAAIETPPAEPSEHRSPAATESASAAALPGFQAESAPVAPLEGDRLLAGKDALFVGYGAMPAWSRDGNRLAFAKLGNGDGIEIYDRAARTTRSVVAAGKNPVFAPSGPDRLAYVKGQGSGEEVWLLDLETGQERRLAAGGFPGWSADASQVYFRKDSLHVQAIPVDPPDAQPAEAWSCFDHAQFPAYSPDGSTIPILSGPGLHLVERPGRITRIWSLPEKRIPQGLLSSWTPDGRFLTIAGDGFGQNYGLWLMNVETGEVRQLIEGDAAQTAWSPDGNHLAVDLRPKDRPVELWIINREKLLPPVNP